jgi:uncharacterized protein YdiU (UPF0061 family)
LITEVSQVSHPTGRGWNLDNSYTRLPAVLFSRSRPMEFPEPRVALLNAVLADSLGLDFSGLSAGELAEVLSGRRLPPEADPIAQAYAGHQFGGFTLLGDGRAILLGEQVTPAGQRYDLQWKGSGPTTYSRRGDGRAALGPMLREYLISEAMQALRVPTTRSLAVLTTGDLVFREGPLPGAVLIRVAASHLRVGTFQLLLARQDNETLRHLADYTIARHDPDLVDHEAKHLEFLRRVIARQARLIAQWQQLGFVHGVMNTDNMALSGETIDYGPCAFLDRYDPATVFSSIDHGGRYAYGNQPSIGLWNLTRFAETLLPLLSPVQDQAIELATDALKQYAPQFEQALLAGYRRKLGLETSEEDDWQLVQGLLEAMQAARADVTNTFAGLADPERWDPAWGQHVALQAWQTRWLGRLEREGSTWEQARERLRQANPQIIPRNERVEEALQSAVSTGDLGPVERLLAALADPFTPSALHGPYRDPPPPGACGYRTFCGT